MFARQRGVCVCVVLARTGCCCCCSLLLLACCCSPASVADEPLTTLDPATVTAGVTPIGGMSALPLSPGGRDPWRSNWVRSARDPTSARTATPGGYNRRKRLPSRGDIERAKQEAELIITPLTAARDFGGDATALPHLQIESVDFHDERRLPLC